MLKTLTDQISTVVLGKHAEVELCVICLLGGGHLLIEDIPGVGKTTLAQALARSLGLNMSRVQFTSDLMPSDLLGTSLYDRAQDAFVFQAGPIFSQVLVADEINRAGPRTQSALLEAMQERQVSIDGQTRALPSPFFVIATQNPTEQRGTHPLPESQLDRFAMSLSMGYPDAATERRLLQGEDRRDALERLQPVLTASQWQDFQNRLTQVHASDALLDYLQALVAATRQHPLCRQGLSPRAALSLLRLAKARATLQQRSHVSPEDLQALWLATVPHRLTLRDGSNGHGRDVARHILDTTAVA